MKSQISLLILAMTALILIGGCTRSPAEPTATISGLIIITATSQPSTTATPQDGYPPPEETPLVVPTESTAYPGLAQITSNPSQEPTAYPGLPQITPLPSQASTAYPGLPQITPLPSQEPTAYPGLIGSATPFPITPVTPTLPVPYPGPGSATPPSSLTGTPTPLHTPTATLSGTPPLIPVEIPPVPAITPPPPGSLVRIWLAWSPEQSRALDEVIDAFQDVYPWIRFEVTNFPLTDLRRRYEIASYYGGGPSLLFGPAEWGPAYYESGLVRDLSPYASEEFLSGINPAAVGTGFYKRALISLPISQDGVVLYRNRVLIPDAAETFDELIAAAHTATRGGNLGAYFDRGAFFSAGNLGGLAGGLMDAEQNPMFNSAAGLSWLDLLEGYDVAGAVGLNTNRDLELFMDGRVGYIIEGTWQLNSLIAELGGEHLVIDPWPEFNSGHLSGFVQADAVFLNPNTKPGDMYAAMLFVGYLLTSDVQQYLAEVGMIPVNLDTAPRPVHIAQAANALAAGTAYPPVSNSRVLTAYWEGLEMAIQAVFTNQIDPQDALLTAEIYVQERLGELVP